MGRTAAPATPGETPTTDTDALAKDALDAGALAAAATSENGDLQAKVADQDKKIAELTALVHMMSRNQAGAAVPEQVALPKYDDVMKDPPAIAVLTDRGWYVPAVLPGMANKV